MSDTLRAQQWALTAHLRDPQHQPAPAGLDGRRLQVYRDLLFNNLQALLAGSFPVLLQVLDDDEWGALCRRYFATHRCTSPLFTQVAAEFVAWLQGTDELPRPFLAELAHYEWVEQALQGLDAVALQAPEAGMDPWSTRLQRSPLAWPLAYHWPVQQLGRECQPDVAPVQATFLLARRRPDGTIGFSQLSALAWQLLEQIHASPARSGADHLRQLARAHGLALPALEAEGRALLAQLVDAGVIGAERSAGR
jgi:hypothetical protein